MKWKEIYDKSNNKKYTVIEEISVPVRLKSTISNFLSKYKWALLLGTIVAILYIIIGLGFNYKIILGLIAIELLGLICMVYYNTYSLRITDKTLLLNIMFKEITLKVEDIVTIYISRQKSNIFLFIPFYFYSINIIYKEGKQFSGYSLSTMMLKKKDVLNFFKHFKFRILEEQKKEDKKEKVYNQVITLFTTLVAIIFIVACILFFIFNR